MLIPQALPTARLKILMSQAATGFKAVLGSLQSFNSISRCWRGQAGSALELGCVVGWALFLWCAKPWRHGGKRGLTGWPH